VNIDAWRLPGARRFAAAIAEDIDDGRTVLVFAPPGTDSGLVAAVKSELLTEWRFLPIPTAEIALSDAGVIGSFIDYLGLILDSHQPRNIDAVASHADLRRRVILLDLRNLDRNQAQQWAAFIRQHSLASRDLPPTERFAVCALTHPANVELPPDDHTFIRHHWWWGALSRLDVEVHVSELLGHTGIDPVVAATIVEVAAFDTSLSEQLVDNWSGNWSDLPELLDQYADSSGLTDCDVPGAVPSTGVQPPRELLDLWWRGGTNRWAELDPAFHSALRHVRSGRELKTRVWRGQVRSLLPTIEVERQNLIQWILTDRRSLSDEWIGQDIAGLEIGPLFKLIRETPVLRTDRPRYGAAAWLRDTRNALTHWNTIDASDLRRGRRLLEEARSAATPGLASPSAHDRSGRRRR